MAFKTPEETLKQAQEIAKADPNATAQTQAAINRGEQKMPVAKVETPVVDQPVQPTSQFPNYEEMIKKMQQAQTEQAIAGLKKARDTALSDISARQEAVAPTYEAMEKEAIVGQQRATKEFEDRLAARGTAGSQAQAETALQVGLLGQLGQLGRAETAELSALERERGQILSGFESDVASARAGAEATAMQNIINLLPTMQEEKTAAEQKKVDDYLSTIGRFSSDYQKEIDNVRNDGDTSNDWQLPYLEAARAQKVQDLNLDPTTGQPLPTTVQYTVPQALDAFRALGYATPEIASALGIDASTKYMDYTRGTGGVASAGSPTTQTSTDYNTYIQNAMRQAQVQTPTGLSVIETPKESVARAIGELITSGQIGRIDAIRAAMENRYSYEEATQLVDSYLGQVQTQPPSVIEPASVTSGLANSVKGITDPYQLRSAVKEYLMRIEQYLNYPEIGQAVANTLVGLGISPDEFLD